MTKVNANHSNELKEKQAWTTQIPTKSGRETPGKYFMSHQWQSV